MDLKYIEKLVLRSKQGDEASKEKLSEEFTPFIKNLSSKYKIPGYDFYDLMGECYKNLFIALDNYQTDKHRFVGFATLSIQNALKTLLRNSKIREEKLTLSNDFGEIILDEPLIEDRVCDDDFRNFLNKCFNNLKKDEKEFVSFVYYENRSLRAFAMAKGIKYNQAKLKNRAILQKLRVFVGA
ncbi:MAG: sigma-70 family RNA polymerase sigma factor [Clostridium sp.]